MHGTTPSRERTEPPLQVSFEAGAITLSAAIFGDIHLEGNMTRDDWKVYSDGSMERLGTLTYPLQGNVIE